MPDLVSHWKQAGGSYTPSAAHYKALGQYMESTGSQWDGNARVKFDNFGIPTVKYGDDYQYNPTTIAQYCLGLYNDYLHDKGTKSKFLQTTDKLIALQGSDGAFRYQFSWQYNVNGQTLAPGWASGIAQGQALSALARAYDMTGDSRYRDAGSKALKFLLTPVAQGGVMDTMAGLHPSLSGYIFFQEYVTNPPSYVLNGYMSILMSLYDWSYTKSGDAPLAGSYFGKGMDTLEHILPYYDVGGVSSYDMSQITYNQLPAVYADYHILVLNLLHTLDSIQPNSAIENMTTYWEQQVSK